MKRLAAWLKWRRQAPAREPTEGATSHDTQLILADEAITEWSQDILGRRTLVERICAAVSAWPSNQPLVLALTGGWGEGKTSVINLVVRELRGAGQHIVIEFDPWFFNSAETLIQGFLTAIENELLSEPEFKRRGSARRTWSQVRRTLSSLPTVSLFGAGVDFSNLRERAAGLEQVRGQVLGLLRSLERKVVVVMDDLDRLDGEDALTALKLVRVWNTLSGFVFVLAFDRDALQRKLASEVQRDPGLIEKLVQVDIRLPAPDARALGAVVDQHLNKIAEVYHVGYEGDFSERLGEMWRSGISRRITTLRHAKRWLNALAFAVPFVGGEVNYADLFALEFVRLFYPSVYEEVRAHRELFSGTSQVGLGAEPENGRRKAYHQELCQGLPTAEDAELVKSVLSNVFPLFEESVKGSGSPYGESWVTEWSKQQRAAAPDRFATYFQYGLPKGEVADVWVRELIGQVNSADEQKIGDIVKGGWQQAKDNGTLGKLLDRLIVLAAEVDRSRAITAIWAVVGQNRLYETRAEAFERSEFQSAAALVSSFAAQIQDSAEVQDVLRQVVKQGPIEFAIHVVHYTTPERNRILTNWTHIDTAALRDELRWRIRREYIDAGRNLLADEPVWGVSALHEIHDKDLATNYLTRLFKADPSELPRFLARYVLRPLDQPEFRSDDLAEYVHIDLLRQELRTLQIAVGATEDERFALGAFFGEPTS